MKPKCEICNKPAPKEATVQGHPLCWQHRRELMKRSGHDDGFVLSRKCRKTKTTIGLYNREAGIESDPDTPWSLVCEDHGTCVCHATKAEAIAWMSDPAGWCPGCRGEPEDTWRGDKIPL